MTKDKELETTKNSLSLIESPINTAQLLTILQKTPRKHVYTRPGKGGGNWEFVTGVYVKKVLNYTFGWLWDFQIIDKDREADQIWVQGRLTIKNKKGEPMIIKEQFGRADIKFKRGTKIILDYGNDLKSASTDALKKCASELGIASDIYGKNEFNDISGQKPVVRGNNTPINSTQRPKTATTASKPKITAYDRLRNELFKLGATNLQEALNVFNDITGQTIKSLPRAEKPALDKIYDLKNSPAYKGYKK